MPTPEKEKLVAEVAEELQSSAAYYLVEFSGLSVTDMTELRGKVLEAGGRLLVIKNRLLKLALQDEERQALEEHLVGPTMVAFCPQDPVGPAQAVAQFSDDHPGLALKAGVVEGSPVTGGQAQAIAKLPPKEQILAEALAAVSSPVSGLVGVLNQAIGELVFVMEAYVDKQQGAA
jgi:large subunit ribosomal protein L10